MRFTIALAGVILLAGCGSGDDRTSEVPTESEAPAVVPAASQGCLDAFEKAAAVGDMEDTVEDLDPAILACESSDAWVAASEAHPKALDGTDPMVFLENRCTFSEDATITSSDLCQSLGG